MSETGLVRRLDGADFLRAFACAIVLFHHVAQHVDQDVLGPSLWWLKPFATGGGYGVAIFFVLSGFLLAGPFWRALDEGRPMPDLRIYFLRRMARIAPGFWIVLTLTFLIVWLIFGAPLTAGYLLRYVAGLTFVAGFHWYTLFPVELNGPLWSISFEVLAYMIMPLGFLALFRIARFVPSRWAMRIAWVGIIILSVGLHWTYVTLLGVGEPVDKAAARATPFWLTYLGHHWFPEYNPLSFFAIFAIGVLASGIQTMVGSRRGATFDAAFLVSLAAAMTLLWTNEGSGFAETLYLPYGLYPTLPLLIGTMLATGPSTLYVARALEPAPVRAFATISFGVYLWHMLYMALVTRFLFPSYHRPGKTEDLGVFVTASGIVIIASLLTASASWRWLEKPAIRWARGKEAAFAPSRRETPERIVEHAGN